MKTLILGTASPSSARVDRCGVLVIHLSRTREQARLPDGYAFDPEIRDANPREIDELVS